jgi:hypothetical protein
MLTIALVLFAAAAVFGIGIAIVLFRKRPTPKPVVALHGLLGASGLVTLVFYAFKQPHRSLTIAIVLLVVAALGGFYLVANDLRGKPGPLALVIIHALAAVIAVILVASVALG